MAGRLLDVGLDSSILEVTPIAQAVNAKANKWDCIKLKSFFTSKETTTKQKGDLMNIKIYLKMTYSIRG